MRTYQVESLTSHPRWQAGESYQNKFCGGCAIYSANSWDAAEEFARLMMTNNEAAHVYVTERDVPTDGSAARPLLTWQYFSGGTGAGYLAAGPVHGA